MGSKANWVSVTSLPRLSPKSSGCLRPSRRISSRGRRIGAFTIGHKLKNARPEGRPILAFRYVTGPRSLAGYCGLTLPRRGRSQGRPLHVSFTFPLVGYPLVIVKFSTPQAEVVPALFASPE